VAKISYEVEKVDPRGEVIAEKLSGAITAGGLQGKELVQVLSTFDYWLLVWKKPARESRG
jgi:hypothetical protein